MDSVMAVSCSSHYGYLTTGLVRILNDSHPITLNVNDFQIQSHGEFANAGLQPGATMLGDYDSAPGCASIAVREVEAGRAVYLGPIYFATFSGYMNEPYYEDADAMLLLKQAIEWAAGDMTGIRGTEPAPVKRAELRGAAPSPFRFRTTINYTLPTAGRASLAVYDLAGKLVKTLVSGHLPAGPGQVTWNRTDDASKKVARGVYFCRLQTEDANLSRKLVAR